MGIPLAALELQSDPGFVRISASGFDNGSNDRGITTGLLCQTKCVMEWQLSLANMVLFQVEAQLFCSDVEIDTG